MLFIEKWACSIPRRLQGTKVTFSFIFLYTMTKLKKDHILHTIIKDDFVLRRI